MRQSFGRATEPGPAAEKHRGNYKLSRKLKLKNCFVSANSRIQNGYEQQNIHRKMIVVQIRSNSLWLVKRGSSVRKAWWRGHFANHLYELGTWSTRYGTKELKTSISLLTNASPNQPFKTLKSFTINEKAKGLKCVFTCWWSLIIVGAGGVWVMHWFTIWSLITVPSTILSEYIYRQNKERLVLLCQTMFEFVTAHYFKWNDSNTKT